MSYIQTISVLEKYHDILQHYVPGDTYRSIYRLVDNTKTLETTQTICQPETGKIYIVIQNNSENKWTSSIIHNRSTAHSLQT